MWRMSNPKQYKCVYLRIIAFLGLNILPFFEVLNKIFIAIKFAALCAASESVFKCFIVLFIFYFLKLYSFIYCLDEIKKSSTLWNFFVGLKMSAQLYFASLAIASVVFMSIITIGNTSDVRSKKRRRK